MQMHSYFYDVSVGSEPDVFKAAGVITSEAASLTSEVLLGIKEEIAIAVNTKFAQQGKLTQQVTAADLNVISLSRMV